MKNNKLKNTKKFPTEKVEGFVRLACKGDGRGGWGGGMKKVLLSISQLYCYIENVEKCCQHPKHMLH